ncbi:hypothetical protein B296_00034275 [Ensete ventricosum]|uniref:Uncharacterized protein n=1 Tax=Ensete ventricosum TaxID=4639 RepID=A0A426XGE7_ENSVE|nr:hypothetical protein B296_00034275 [Ensete ventricosum]
MGVTHGRSPTRARLAAASPQGAAAPIAGEASPWHGGYRPQRAAVAYAGAATAGGGISLAWRLPTTKGSRRLRRGSDGGGAVRVKEG